MDVQLNPGVIVREARFKRIIYSDSQVSPMAGGWAETDRALNPPQLRHTPRHYRIPHRGIVG
jgi:hypothetical protein